MPRICSASLCEVWQEGIGATARQLAIHVHGFACDLQRAVAIAHVAQHTAEVVEAHSQFGQKERHRGEVLTSLRRMSTDSRVACSAPSRSPT